MNFLRLPIEMLKCSAETCNQAHTTGVSRNLMNRIQRARVKGKVLWYGWDDFPCWLVFLDAFPCFLTIDSSNGRRLIEFDCPEDLGYC